MRCFMGRLGNSGQKNLDGMVSRRIATSRREGPRTWSSPPEQSGSGLLGARNFVHELCDDPRGLGNELRVVSRKPAGRDIKVVIDPHAQVAAQYGSATATR